MKSRIQDLLVYGVNWIGDAVISLGTLQGIRDVSPSTRITVLASTRTADIYRMSPAVERVVERSGSLDHPDLGIDFALALCFPLSFRSALELRLTGIPERIGFAHEFRSILLTRSLDYQEWKKCAQHQSTYYRAIGEAAFGPLPVERPKIEVSDELLRRAEEYLDTYGFQKSPIIGINPGAHYGSAKMWPESYYVDVIDRILSIFQDVRIVLFAGEKDRAVPARIQEKLKSSRLLSTDGKIELMLSVAILSKCRFVITNDSGMMHIGDALNIPGVVFFGPTDPVATGPQSPAIRILSYPVRCAPCLLRECPIDHRCMERLNPDDVWPSIRSGISEAIGS
jgi:heptosyltransferase-2